MTAKNIAKKAVEKPEKRIVSRQSERKAALHDKVSASQVKMPDEKALEIIKRYGISLPSHSFVKTAKELPAALKKTGFPSIMKVSGRNIVHKTELGGILTVNNGQEAMEALKKLLLIKDAEKVLVQKKLEGIEVIVGAKRDPQFGAVVVFGFGGIYTEIIKDVVFRICPLSPEDAEQMVKSIKGYEILAGARGKIVNIEALKDVIVRVCRLASREGIKEMDINPLFCNEQGCWAADVRIVVK